MRDKIDAWAKSSLGILLIGQDELTYEYALYAASLKLNCSVEELTSHPDFVSIEAEKGKALKVEDIALVAERAYVKAKKADKVVFLIRSLDNSSSGVPHKILKELEENSNVCFIITSGSGVLDTIKSRCIVVECRGEVQYTDDTQALALMGQKGEVNEKLARTFSAVRECISNGELKELFDILHLVKEKDKESFFEINKADTEKLLNLISNLFIDILLYETCENVGGSIAEPQVSFNADLLKNAIEMINKEKARVNRVGYTKDDFFFFFANLIYKLSP